jgi:hypothetical protein
LGHELGGYSCPKTIGTLWSKQESIVPREIPKLTDVSPGYARITARLAALTERENALNAEKRKGLQAIASWGQTADQNQQSRVDDIVAGKPFERRSTVYQETQARLADIEEERQLAREAQHQLQNERADEYHRASRLVCAAFADEHRALAEKFYNQLAAAAETRVEIGLLQLDIERSGASSSYLHDVGIDLLDGSLDRTGAMAQELRNGIRLGFMNANAMPVELR